MVRGLKTPMCLCVCKCVSVFSSVCRKNCFLILASLMPPFVFFMFI